MTRFKATKTASRNTNIADHEYRITFEHNEHYVLGYMRFEKIGKYGPGWNIRCSECDEDLERRVRALLHRNGRNVALDFALQTFREAYEELENEIA